MTSMMFTEVWKRQVPVTCVKQAKCRSKNKALLQPPPRYDNQKSLQLNKFPNRARSQASPRSRFSTIAISMTISELCSQVSINLRLLMSPRSQPPHQHTARTSSSKMKPRKWSIAAIRPSTSREHLSHITPTNLLKWKETCAFFENGGTTIENRRNRKCTLSYLIWPRDFFHQKLFRFYRI